MLSLWSDATTGIQVTRLDVSETGGKDAGHLHLLLQLFRAVAEEEGWQAGAALDREHQQSVYFLLKVQEQIVGGLQLTLPDYQGTLPCFDLWPEAASSASRATKKHAVAHIGILAIAPAFRGQSLLFWRLVVEMWRYCVGQGIATLYIEVTPRVLPLYQRLGWPLRIQGSLRRHWGENCYLCSLSVSEVAEVLLRRAECSLHCQQIIAQAFRVEFITSERPTERPRVIAPIKARRLVAATTIVRERPGTYLYSIGAAVGA